MSISIKTKICFLCLGICLLAYACRQSKEEKMFDADYIKSSMLTTADWQLRHPKHDPRDWTNAALYDGLFAAYEATGNRWLYTTLMQIADSAGRQPGKRWYHADDIAVCHTYINLYRTEKDPRMLVPTADTLALHLSQPYPSRSDLDVIKWWWCDALFMGPPTLVKMGITTGNSHYLEMNDRFYRECYDLLYNKEEHLFARDLRFVVKNDSTDLYEANGRKIFWSRGNGWVMGGLVQILRELPANYPLRPFYETLFAEMAAKILLLQQADGLWRASLLDPESYPGGEVSGSGFFCYAFAWGINTGLLNREKYLPAVEKCWIALNRCINDEGRIGWVQPIGADPRSNFDENSWEVYGTGAYLLAASEIIRLKR
jgi:rhamnogalacturonyl hydrolase YesR